MMLSPFWPWGLPSPALIGGLLSRLIIKFYIEAYYKGLYYKAYIIKAYYKAFLVVQLSHLQMTTGKTIALTTQTFVCKMMSLLFNTLSGFAIAVLPRGKRLLISWLQSLSTVILEPKKIKSVTVSIFSPSVCREVVGPDAMILVFWILSFKPNNFFTLLFHFHQEAL